MSGRGRTQRGNAGTNSPMGRTQRGNAGTNSPVNRPGRLASTTRSTAGSPSSRTRSLGSSKAASPATSVKKQQAIKKVPGGSAKASPKASPANNSSSNSTNSVSSAKANSRRNSVEERRRKSRRPKFQDNPPAPEIVENKALQLAEQASRDSSKESVKPSDTSDDTDPPTTQAKSPEKISPELTKTEVKADDTSKVKDEEEEEEEEEVDDDEDAAVAAAAQAALASSEKGKETNEGCESNKVSKTANGVPESKEVTSNGIEPSSPPIDHQSKKRAPSTSPMEKGVEVAKKAKLSLSDSVSTLVDDIVRRIDNEPLEGESSDIKNENNELIKDDSEAMEEATQSPLVNGQSKSAHHLSESDLNVSFSGLKGVILKQFNEAVKDLSDPLEIKNGLTSRLKAVLVNKSSTQNVTFSKLENPTQDLSEIVALCVNKVEARSAIINELVTIYLESNPESHQENLSEEEEEVDDVEEEVDDVEEEVNDVEEEEEEEVDDDEDARMTAELKIVEDIVDNNESTTDSFPPDLMPQVDGVDSSAEGRSDDQKDDNNSLGDSKDQNMGTNNQHELNDNTEDGCDDLKTNNTANHKAAAANNASAKCDKSKILSEMENKFAKETHNALKNRPTYKRRNQSEGWELSNGKSELDVDGSPRKIILMKEPGELEVVAASAMSPQLATNIVQSESDNGQMLCTPPNDENHSPSAASAGVTSPSSMNSSSSTLKTLRKFRKSSRNPSFSNDPSISYSASDLPSLTTNDHEGPPYIVKGTSPAKAAPRLAMSPPPLTPEVGPSSMPTPLRIDIPDHYHHHLTSPMSSSSFSGYSRRLLLRTPPAARAGLVTMVSEAVLSKEDAETAATAVQLTPPPVIVPLGVVGTKPLLNDEHPSLKIRLPKNGSGPSLVITSSSPSLPSSSSLATSNIPIAVTDSSSATPHHKKVPKRRNLQNESDELDTEEEASDDPYQKANVAKKSKKDLLQVEPTVIDPEKLSADEETDNGGKTTPDSQITSDDRQA